MILKASYIGLSILMILIMMIIFIKTKRKVEGASPSVLYLIVPIALWLVYLGVLSYQEILFDASFPKFPLFLFLPFFLFTMVFYVKFRNNEFIQSIPLHWTAFYQAFRVPVELILFGTFLTEIIPVDATFEGANFDILVGISGIFIGVLIYKTGMKYKLLLKIWNTLGIVMVLIVGVVIGVSMFKPEILGYSEIQLHPDFLTMPYLLIPGFLAPSAIFIHVVSFIQLRR
jgi:hypothetical protein